MKSWVVDLLLVVGVIVGLLPGLLLGGGLPDIISPIVKPVPVPSTITRAVYVYEKDEGGVPPSVEFALNEISRAGKISIAVIDDDVIEFADGTTLSYKPAITAAREAGLPALIVEADGKTIKIVKSPITEEQILEAVQ